MDITKLTIQGFKSFYEKSVFTFGKNITAIVGPNGSGKSNITEGLRFVLGEQSTKSLRGKDITDLLFRSNTAKASKAKVEVEFTKTNNSKIALGSSDNIFIKNLLEKETVSIARTVFADGKSIYEMNGSEVRLKDIQEFLLYVHLGNKSSWHISQGEADKVLQASPETRKTIVEDALGLKVYHSRINEAERKLLKTKENIREASLQRKEILPEISMLYKQVERIKKGTEFRNELLEKGNLFLNYKILKINNLKKENENVEDINVWTNKLGTLEEKIGKMQASLNRENGGDENFLQNEIQKEEKVLNFLLDNLLTLQSEKSASNNNLSYSTLEEEKSLKELIEIDKELREISFAGNDVLFSEIDLNRTKNEIEEDVEKILNNEDINVLQNSGRNIDLTLKKLLSRGSVVTKDNIKQISYLQNIKMRLQEKLRSVKVEKENSEKKLQDILPIIENEDLKIKLSKDHLDNLRKQIMEFKYLKIEKENEIQKLIFERSNLQIKIVEMKNVYSKIEEYESEYKNDLKEFKNILGENFNIEKNDNLNIISDEEFINLKRNIERLKIRLEESQVPNPAEILDKYKIMTEKDEYLLKEISDLENSMINLETLILDLKNSLKKEFETGLEHINIIFDSYVKRLFGGGSAKVFVIDIESKRKNKLENFEIDDKDNNDNDDEELKLGVDVEVEIPKKKIKGLHSLSGGERALISIALNFAIINQNPAPFMILDETDAALDEANSKRYGEILEMLKEKTKLIVVTHNRETMHFADQIFGVTLHKDGHSKILSVSFDDAVEYAK